MFCDPQEIYDRYVTENISKLEEWSCKKYSTVLYDSDNDGKDSSIFREKILNHSHLYFIVIDSNDNVFGHYHDGVIDRIAKDETNEEDKDEFDDKCYDSQLFMFTLNSNGRSRVERYDRKCSRIYTMINNDYSYYDLGKCDHDNYCHISNIVNDSSFNENN